MERVKRLAGNEIELGMMIPTVESGASNIPMTKGIMYLVIGSYIFYEDLYRSNRKTTYVVPFCHR